MIESSLPYLTLQTMLWVKQVGILFSEKTIVQVQRASGVCFSVHITFDIYKLIDDTADGSLNILQCVIVREVANVSALTYPCRTRRAYRTCCVC